MKILKKIGAFCAIFLMLITTVLEMSSIAYANDSDRPGNDEIVLEASRDSDTITITMKTVKDLEFGGFTAYNEYDSRTTHNGYNTPGFTNTDYYDVTGIYSISSGNIIDAKSGTVLMNVFYKLKDDFQYDTEYVFKFEFWEGFNSAQTIDYEFGKDQKFQVTYIEHTVSFNLNYDTDETIDNQYVVDGEKATEPTAPTREGYTFKGWKKSDKAFDFSTAITEKTELIAEWEAEKHAVKYEVTGDTPEGYTVPEGKSVAYGEEVTVETAPDPTQYTEKDGIPGTWSFAGWTAPEGVTVEDGSFSMPNSDITFTGTWEFTPNSHKVTYTVSGDAPITSSGVPAEATYPVGTEVSIAAGLTTTETTKDSVPGTWTFNGWDKTEAFFMPDEDVTITGSWSFAADKYDVSYIVNGDKPSDYVEPNGPKEVEAGTGLEMPGDLTTSATAKDGVPGTWKFSGWTITAPEGLSASEGKYTMPASNVTITGSWTFEATTYTVKFVDEDGEAVLLTEKTYTAGTSADAIEKPDNPTKEATDEFAYKFAGWSPEVSDVNADVVYKATYTATKKQYTVTFVDEDGSVLKEAIAYDYGTAADNIEKPADPTKESTAQNTYTFAGWTPTVADVTGDATYTATYTTTTNIYTIIWMDGDGNTLKTEKFAYGETPSYTGKTPIKAEDSENTYTFAGWTPSIEPVTGDTTYTATFTATPIPHHTITFVDEDGTTVLATVTVKEGETPVYNGNTPTKAEDENNTYTFDGWTPSIVPATGNATYTATYRANRKDHYNLTDPVLPDPNQQTDPTTPETVTITWLNHDGTLIEKTTVAYNSTPSHADPILAPSAEGKTYTFKGWSPTIVSATADAAYTAQFTATDDETGETEDTTVPTVVTPENTDTNPTNHEDLPSVTTKAHTYEIYQIFTGDYAALNGNDVLSNIVWGQNGKGTDSENPVSVGDPVSQSVLEALNKVVDENLDRTKLNEIEKYVTINGNPYTTITLKDGDQENTIQLPPGYYLIRDVEGSQTGKEDAYTTYITVVIKDYTIQPKSVIPTVDKQVYDNDDQSNTAGWSESADHNINESFQFALIATIPQNEHLKDYTNGYFVRFTDQMSSGVTFESIESVTVKSGNMSKTVTAGELSSGGYTLTDVSEGTAGGTMTVTMDLRTILGADSFGAGTEDITVIVTYNAHLNENAIVHKASDPGTTANNTNSNSVYLEYSNNPNTGYGSDMGKTETDYVWVFTYGVDNRKVDEADHALAGAGFKLYNSTGETEIKLAKGADSNNKVVYYPVANGDGVEMKTTAENNTFNVVGLDVGTYVLKETTTPAGYNTCADTTVTITASHEENEAGTGAKLNLTGTNMDNTIINQSGSTLPSTGGIGTKLFYVFGTILTLGAVILLVTKRRADTE